LNSSVGSSPGTGGLPVAVLNSVTLVHATTNEFLCHFWLAFLSGDQKRAGDIAKLSSSLKNSKDRMEAIAVRADEEREVERQRKKREAQEEYRRTGVKPKRKSADVEGGRKVVEELLGPTIIAVDRALSKYQIALNEAGQPGVAS
jgi:transcription initiation factor TFIIH subunit 1